jgi:hypothetical protein
MRPSTMMGKGFLALALLTASLVMGCNTYHYFDIDVEFGPVNEEDASLLQLCTLTVSGADSHSGDFPSSVVGLAPNEPSTCPPSGSWTGTMGTFEYSTFADSGSLTFTVNGYKNLQANSGNLCTSGDTTVSATSQITTPGKITMGSFDSTNCPPMITP